MTNEESHETRIATLDAATLLGTFAMLDHVLAGGGDRFPGPLFDHHDGHLRLVATDGHRLIVRDLPNVPVTSDFAPFILPARTLTFLSDFEGAIALSLRDGKLHVEDNEKPRSFDVIHGPRFNYRNVLRGTDAHAVTVNVGELMKFLADWWAAAVFGGPLVTIEGPEAPVPNPFPIKIGFRTEYLFALLRTFLGRETIIMGLGGPEDPAIVREDAITYVLMPMKGRWVR